MATRHPALTLHPPKGDRKRGQGDCRREGRRSRSCGRSHHPSSALPLPFLNLNSQVAALGTEAAFGKRFLLIGGSPSYAEIAAAVKALSLSSLSPCFRCDRHLHSSNTIADAHADTHADTNAIDNAID